MLKTGPKNPKKKLKNIRSPQNFDLMHSLGAKYIHFKSGLVKPDYLQKSYLGDLNEPCQPNFSINMCGRQCRFWGSCNLGLDLFPERCDQYSADQLRITLGSIEGDRFPTKKL